MTYLAEYLWGWLLGAALIGLAMGWVSLVHRGTGVPRKALPWIALGVVALIALAVARAAPGRFGYWLDLALVMFAFYLTGCAVGSWLRGVFMRRRYALTPTATHQADNGT